jgi:hypothetical protein
VPYPSAFHRRRLGRPDVHAAIYLHRIGVDDLAGQSARQLDRQVALARCRRADDGDDRWAHRHASSVPAGEGGVPASVGERTSAVALPDRNQIPDAERGIFVEQLGVERGISSGAGEHLPRRPAGGSKLRPQCGVKRHQGGRVRGA